MTMSKLFIILGIFMLVIGLILHYAPGLFAWFGKLPGDIRIQNDRSRIFIPITSMIIISLLATLLLNFWKR